MNRYIWYTSEKKGEEGEGQEKQGTMKITPPPHLLWKENNQTCPQK